MIYIMYRLFHVATSAAVMSSPMYMVTLSPVSLSSGMYSSLPAPWMSDDRDSVVHVYARGCRCRHHLCHIDFVQ